MNKYQEQRESWKRREKVWKALSKQREWESEQRRLLWKQEEERDRFAQGRKLAEEGDREPLPGEFNAQEKLRYEAYWREVSKRRG